MANPIDLSPPPLGDNPQELNYAGAGMKKPRAPRSGILAFVAMALQIPWVFIMILPLWGAEPIFDRLPKILAGAVFAAIMALPTFVGLVSGIYSYKTGGGFGRNTLGMLGLIFAILGLIYFVCMLLVGLMQYTV